KCKCGTSEIKVATAAPPLALRTPPAYLPSISMANFQVDEPLVAAGMLILLSFKYSALWPDLLDLVSRPMCVVRNKHRSPAGACSVQRRFDPRRSGAATVLRGLDCKTDPSFRRMKKEKLFCRPRA